MHPYSLLQDWQDFAAELAAAGAGWLTFCPGLILFNAGVDCLDAGNAIAGLVSDTLKCVAILYKILDGVFAVVTSIPFNGFADKHGDSR